jgi:hypothetical protein
MSFAVKVFVLCEIKSGSFRPNIETDESADYYFKTPHDISKIL